MIELALTPCSKDHPCLAIQSLSCTQLTPSAWLVPRAKCHCWSTLYMCSKNCPRSKTQSNIVIQVATKTITRTYHGLYFCLLASRLKKHLTSYWLPSMHSGMVWKSSAPCTHVIVFPMWLACNYIHSKLAFEIKCYSLDIIITAVHCTVFPTVCQVAVCHTFAAHPSLTNGSHVFPSWFSCDS